MDSPTRYCRTCSYDLRGLPANRCPECGTEFDPADARTWRSLPRRGWGRWVRRIAAGVLVIVLITGGAWTWCSWEWRAEQQVLATARGQFNLVQTRMVRSQWLHQRLGRLGFVLAGRWGGLLRSRPSPRVLGE